MVEQRRILLATTNHHKLLEMRDLMVDSGFEIVGGAALGGLPAVLEDGLTFTANAIKKAVEVSAVCEWPVVADDSGFAVLALAGAPGVFSARYAGSQATDEDNVRKLLAAMAGETDRRACFHCVLAVAFKGDLMGTVEGRVEGQVTQRPLGEHGFGYDPIFIPAGQTLTFAQLPPAVKNRLSHRARATLALRQSGLLERSLQSEQA